MPVTIDHIGLPATDPLASASFLSELLGARAPEPAGPDGDMFSVPLDGCEILFTESKSIFSHHVAFAVAAETFAAAIEKLRAAKIAFGNAPDDATNGETSDPLGGAGRLYFSDRDGHFFELTIR